MANATENTTERRLRAYYLCSESTCNTEISLWWSEREALKPWDQRRSCLWSHCPSNHFPALLPVIERDGYLLLHSSEGLEPARVDSHKVYPRMACLVPLSWVAQQLPADVDEFVITRVDFNEDSFSCEVSISYDGGVMTEDFLGYWVTMAMGQDDWEEHREERRDFNLYAYTPFEDDLQEGPQRKVFSIKAGFFNPVEGLDEGVELGHLPSTPELEEMLDRWTSADIPPEWEGII